MPTPPLTVACPHCKKPVEWRRDNLFRPFCSERCKLIDLGEWAAEEKVIPGEAVESDNEIPGEAYFE